MWIRAYSSGDGMCYRTHPSLFFVVMKGEFDTLLKWPFEYKVSLTPVGPDTLATYCAGIQVPFKWSE